MINFYTIYVQSENVQIINKSNAYDRALFRVSRKSLAFFLFIVIAVIIEAS